MTLFNKLFSRRSSQSRQVSVGKVPHYRRQHPGNGHAYVLVVDESSSTGSRFRLAGNRTISRIDAIRRAARNYLHQLRATHAGQKVAVVGFSNSATLYPPLSPVGRSFAGLNRALANLHPQAATNLSAGLDLALAQLPRRNTSRPHLVIVTDGAANVDTGRLPHLIQQARSAGVRIYTIGVGNNGDCDYDPELLKRMAFMTGGRFSSAHSFESLCHALQQAG